MSCCSDESGWSTYSKIEILSLQVRTPMADLKQLEFYVLRYAPYVVRRDFISIGVLLVEPRLNGFGFADVA
jgi:hypothetical protein